MKISFADLVLPKEGALVAAVYEGSMLSPTAQEVDTATGGAVARALKRGRFSGNFKQTLDLVAPAGLGADRVLLLGVGKQEELDQRRRQDLGGTIYRHLAGTGAASVTVLVDSTPEAAADVAYGLRLASYRFDKYRTTLKPEDRPSLAAAVFGSPDAKASRRLFGRLDKVADGVFFARDLVSEPPNVLYPETLAREAKTLEKLGVEVEILGEKELRKLGMGSLLGVAQGSARAPRVVLMHWKGATGGANAKPVAFVGKGVTFDTGGISIKPAAGMEAMKWDMGGSAAVIGLMRALAGRKAKVNAVGAVGLVENMPSGTAQRPGDVVTSMSGQTIEVINTDAEGRLVLADVLWHVQQKFAPRAIVDLATLTGAIVVSLGHHHAGLFANDDDLAARLLAAGEASGERLWRMPLGEAYDEEIKSDIADMKNVGGREGGSITAACFLQRFVRDVPWAHLDIAGTAWSSKGEPTVPKGGTGFGVRLLDRLVADGFES